MRAAVRVIVNVQLRLQTHALALFKRTDRLWFLNQG
jgi:hypothetical protein